MNRRDFLNFPLKGIKNNKEENSNVENKRSESKSSESDKIDLSALASDFTEEMLFMEIMKMGIDPANLSHDQMLEIIFNKLEKNSQKA
jgi:hypothetical protein